MRSHFTAHWPAGSWVLLIEPGDLVEEGKHYFERTDQPERLFTVEQSLAEACRFPSAAASALAASSVEQTAHLGVESVERFSGDVNKVRTELDQAGRNQDVFVVCPTEAEARRLSDLFGETALARAGRLRFPLGRVRTGFRLVSAATVVVGSNELFQRHDLARPTRRRLGKVIDSFLDLREGDLVVHVGHGIARFHGIKLLENEGRSAEHLELEFAESVRMYVPVAKIELVQKYVGGGKVRPSLSKIGGRSWGRAKASAEAAVADLAAEMLELQASRAVRPGIAFPADSEWQREFDAAFPYEETVDQEAAIAAIKEDMTAPRPMDRLICGDVGFGKTEVAMRAVFKAVDAGHQVAVLVPTTILAEQHGRTFTERMAEYPFQIRVLSRFCTGKEERAILAGLADGSVDIAIGTHRLVQNDVVFQNLGLIVIDEEQRFGVAVKERLKAVRQVVDVLTLTATPIPRTLHMSLLGLRDISNLETPPADRLAVETRVARFEPDLVRHAIRRELGREGQAFFVHNRVHDMHEMASRLRSIVPEARIVVGHGQMSEHELEDVMTKFIRREADILLATTIIESGLDIPNANTIFIDDADRYGLAELHQLRGRVGRYKHRAYCYLLLDPKRSLNPVAVRRLKAIEEFSEMGAGFAIAMRDLEIRGAGNILGPEQSGHIGAVGYELYCELLEQAVRRLKKLPGRKPGEVDLQLPGEAYLPRRYVPEPRAKIDFYRRLARAGAPNEIEDLRAEMTDRYGPAPTEALRLFGLAELRLQCLRWRVDRLHLEPGFAVLSYQDRPTIERLARRTKPALRIADDRTAFWPIKAPPRDPDALRRLLQSMLQSA
jgi:transcription-repair coupling factor (superfamily II helicase)